MYTTPKEPGLLPTPPSGYYMFLITSVSPALHRYLRKTYGKALVPQPPFLAMLCVRMVISLWPLLCPFLTFPPTHWDHCPYLFFIYGKHINHSQCHLDILNECQIQLIFCLVHGALASHTSSTWPLSSDLIMHTTHLSLIWSHFIVLISIHVCQSYHKCIAEKDWILYIFPLPPTQCTSCSRKSGTVCW